MFEEHTVRCQVIQPGSLGFVVAVAAEPAVIVILGSDPEDVREVRCDGGQLENECADQQQEGLHG